MYHTFKRNRRSRYLGALLVFMSVRDPVAGATVQDPSTSPEIVKLAGALSDCITDAYAVNRKIDQQNGTRRDSYKEKSLRIAIEACAPQRHILEERYDAHFGPGMGRVFLEKSYLPDLNRAIMERMSDTPDRKKDARTLQAKRVYISGPETRDCRYKFLLEKGVQRKANESFATIKLREDLIGRKFAVTAVDLDLPPIDDPDLLSFTLSDWKQAEACFPFYKQKMDALRTEYDLRSKESDGHTGASRVR